MELSIKVKQVRIFLIIQNNSLHKVLHALKLILHKLTFYVTSTLIAQNSAGEIKLTIDQYFTQ